MCYLVACLSLFCVCLGLWCSGLVVWAVVLGLFLLFADMFVCCDCVYLGLCVGFVMIVNSCLFLCVSYELCCFFGGGFWLI